MDVTEPHVRHRGFVVIHTDPSLDDETESAEGVTVRVRIPRSTLPRRLTVSSSSPIVHRGSLRSSSVRASDTHSTDDGEIRSTTGTGIRQRSHSPR